MENSPGISICIVNWNTREELRECLESIRGCGIDLETIVCDNASSDGSSEMVRSEFADVTLIANNRNIGFGKGNNLCFKKCTRKYVLIANPDIVINKTALEQLTSVMDNDSSVGAVGALLLDSDGVPQKHYYRKFPNLLQHMIYHTGLRLIFINAKSIRYRLWEDNTETDEIIDVDQPPGACLMVRRELLNELGGFNERFDLFYEDVDLCRRIKNNGLRIVMNPAARIVHSGQKSLDKELQSNIRQLFYQSGALYYRLHKGTLQALIYKIIYIADDFLKIIIRALLYPFIPSRRATFSRNIRNSIVFIVKALSGKKATLP